MEYLNDHIYLTFILGFTWGVIMTFIYNSLYEVFLKKYEKEKK